MNKSFLKCVMSITVCFLFFIFIGNTNVVYATEKSTIYCDDKSCTKVNYTVSDSITLYKGQNNKINVKCDKSIAYSIKYKSSNSSVVTVSKNGTISGVKAGRAVITTVISGKGLKNSLSFETVVTVSNPEIHIISTKRTLKVGEKHKLLVLKKGISKPVKWSVNKTRYAKISSRGIISAKKAGNITVTARCGNLKDTFNIKIVK